MNFLPCPFCGNEELSINLEHDGVQDLFFVECDTGKCDARGPIATVAQEAIDAWNERIIKL